MVTLRPKGFKPSKIVANQIILPDDYQSPAFVIHPPTSKLAEMLVVDSTALQDENYSGIYDDSGDYIPQYCDNPDEIPQGSLKANQESSESQSGTQTQNESSESNTQGDQQNENKD